MIHKRPFLIVLLVVSAALACVPAARGQDAIRSSLAGEWTGSVVLDGAPFPCALRFSKILNGAFLEGMLTVYQDAEKKTVVLEERTIIGEQDGNRHSYFAFSTGGLRQSGSWTGSDRSLSVSVIASDGTEEAIHLLLSDPSHLRRTATTQNAEGDILKTSRMELVRVQ